MRDRLKELIDAFFMINKMLYIITEEEIIVQRVVRTFKYLDDLGIEFECTLWEKDREGFLHLKTNIVHFQEIGKTVFLSRKEAEKALKERENNG
jgi:hypothetical protein